MKINKLIISAGILCLLSLTACDGNNTNENKIKDLKRYTHDMVRSGKDVGVEYVDDKTGEPITGIYVNVFDNGRPFHEWEYKNGVRDGFYKEYYKTGELYFECNYKPYPLDKGGTMSLMTGHCKKYYKSGTVWLDYIYENDNPVSTKEYAPEGYLKEEDFGKIIKLDEDKRAVMIHTYRHNSYYPNGELRKEEYETDDGRKIYRSY